MQKYLPQEVAYAYAVNQGTTGTASINTLTPRRPWYSRYGNDLFSHALYSNALQKSNMNTDSLGINAHILGNRHYELTNHLGNVQGTILDRTTPIIDHTVIGYKADIATAQDYYPFGMLMPGRYVTDTGKHCVTINTTILVPKVTRVWMEARTDVVELVYLGGSSPTPVHQLTAAASFAEESLYMYHYVDAAEHPGGVVASTSIGGDGQMESTLDLSYEPSGISTYLILHPDTGQSHQRVGFGISLDADHTTEVRVRQYSNGSSDEYYDALGWQTITTAGDQQLLVPVDKASILAGGKTILELRIAKIGGGTFAGGKNATLFNPYTLITTYVPESRIATICDEPDNYRFGFNGKEKDNEAKGLGNSLDFGARMYDSRIARFLSIDPLAKEYSHQSPYVFAGNTPIQAIDLDGEQPFFVPAASAWRIAPQIGLLSESDVHIRPVVRQTPSTPTQSSRPTFSPKQLESFSRGRQIESEQLKQMGMEKNTKPFEVEVDGKPVKTIPDGLRNGPNGGKQTVEIKNVKNQSRTSQLKAQEKISNSNGERPILRINKDAKISRPVIESFDIEFYNIAPGTTAPAQDNVKHAPIMDKNNVKPKPCEDCI